MDRALPEPDSVPNSEDEFPERRASIVLVTRDGGVLGRLPEIPVASPWWADVAAVVEAAREAFGLDLVVLRMLDSERPRPHGGLVTYLAEADAASVAWPAVAAVLEPFDGTLDEQPLRPRWAKPGGPDADLAWAEGVLRARGIERDGRAEQIRSWNLSSIWRLPLAGDEPAWLKVVPPFFAHEGAMLRRLQGGPVPRLIGHDRDRVLLADVPGTDRYDAPEPELLEMVTILVGLQHDWIGRTDDLLSIGLPDWRGPALTARIADVVSRRGSELDPADEAMLAGFVDALPGRFDAVAACGMPDGLVHGDFHPGNVRGTAGHLTVLDWGDCSVGQPLLDLPAFLGVVKPDASGRIRRSWLDRWRRALPDADPDRAAVLLEPVAAARLAVVFQLFVDHIEPVERRHHDADVLDWLARTAAVLRAAGGTDGAQTQ